MVRYVVAALAILFAVACGREVVFVDPPPTSGDDTGSDTTGSDTTSVRRVDLQVTVQVSAAEAALAEHLGFAGGRVPNAQVTARRVERGQPLQAGTTDAAGQLMLPGLLEGTWAITVLRSLTDAERAALDSADRDVTGFGGAGQFPVTVSQTAATLEVFAGRQGTLVISEAYLPYPIVATGNNYLQGQYIEVHNNSFETIYLDGKILGRSIPFVTDGSASFPCEESAPWREDPEGIWTRLFWAFPGSGQTYPVPPGGSVIVATDAIDHRTFDPGLLDLSTANFEFIGATDVDNPAVPNMVNLPGWSNFGDPTGHGPRWVSDISIFLAEPVNIDSLPRANFPVQNPLHLRFPKEAILDVLTSGSTPETKIGAPYCANFVHPRFDQRFAQLMDGSPVRSLVRKALDDLLLQRTRVSAEDFHHASPSPGRAP